MSHIVIDGRMIRRRYTGIGRYTRNLLSQLEKLDHHNHYTVVMHQQDLGEWQPTQANFTRHPIRTAGAYSLSEQTRLPRILHSLQPDLVHFTAPNLPLGYRQRFVVTVHDLTLLNHKNIRSSRLRYEVKYRAFAAVMRHAVRDSAAIIAPSQHGIDELVQRYGTGIRTKAHVTYEATDAPIKASPAAVPFAAPYLLYVGGFYPYKNLGAVIAALPALVQRYPDISLVLAGQADGFRQALLDQAQQLGVADRIHATGFVDDATLANLYRQAAVYVFPSLSEGFGLPGLEAMSYGLPVASSRASCLPEVYADAAAYFNPDDPADIAQVVGDLLGDQRRQAALKRAGQARVKQFSWKHMATQTLAIYKDVLGQT